ncbi:hypothetical protein [Kingella potus]|uniref:hypothetical protein n=1 Tax=Kingella potus TaxID=265175 RepID=UPI001FD5DC44|nr:hypothetical protein [Kingella potus]UOP01178.1 hypothetical protein LVJ84_02375 [Kingella potus]
MRRSHVRIPTNQLKRPSENCNTFFRRPHVSPPPSPAVRMERVRHVGGTSYPNRNISAPRQSNVGCVAQPRTRSHRCRGRLKTQSRSKPAPSPAPAWRVRKGLYVEPLCLLPRKCCPNGKRPP